MLWVGKGPNGFDERYVGFLEASREVEERFIIRAAMNVEGGPVRVTNVEDLQKLLLAIRWTIGEVVMTHHDVGDVCIKHPRVVEVFRLIRTAGEVS